jgi:starch synthase
MANDAGNAPSPAPMFIVQISSECAPGAKVGGLADVIQGLSRQLEANGHAVEIILPKYDCLRYDRIEGLTKSYNDLLVPYYQQQIHCTVYFGKMDGLRCFFIEPHSTHSFFDRRTIYGQHDDIERFAFFCRAALEFLLRTNKHPDIIHCHDWQTGLVPVLLFEMYARFGMTHPRVCYTLHNVGHQGVGGDQILREVGLNPGDLMRGDRMQDNNNRFGANLMKGGIVFANFITTVSPRYAEEIKNSGLGMGLQPTLRAYHNKFGGVLNGIDYNVWNPETDKSIPCHYSVKTIADKYKNKDALRQRLGMREAFKPIVAVVSRLDHQKGVDLIAQAIPYCLEKNCQFVLLGSSPSAQINQRFWHIKHLLHAHPDCRLELGYDEDLAHLIYAGADMILVPSIYEPCGLTQMIAMRYGTVPVVRNTGGLADTVFDANHANKPKHARNGYVFNDYNQAGLESALARAIGLWFEFPDLFRELMINAMNCDYSWNHPAKHYTNIYNYIADRPLTAERAKG